MTMHQSTLDYIAGEPVWLIAERHGVTPKTVRKRARLAGVVGRKAKVVGDKAKEIIRLYRRGVVWTDIMRIEGIDGHTLSDVLRRHRVKLRTRKR